MFPRLLLLALLAAGPCLAAETALTPQARALIAPFFEAYAHVDREHAALPPARTDSERLIRMGQIDQATRGGVWQTIDLSILPPDQQAAASKVTSEEGTRRDLDNQTKLKAMLPPEGWFLKSVYGAEAANAAFLIVQHAINDTELLHKVLATMEPLVPRGEVDGQAYALLYDRTAMMDTRYQRYGSQMICKDHKWVLYPVEDAEGVDAKRKAMGFALNLSQNLARFENRPPCLSDWPGALPK